MYYANITHLYKMYEEKSYMQFEVEKSYKKLIII